MCHDCPDVERLIAAVAALDPEDRLLLSWRCGCGLTFVAISKSIASSPRAVRYRYHRALSRLAARFIVPPPGS